MDWERLRIFARAIGQGMTKEQVAGMGYFKIPSDEALWVEANKNPAEHAEMEIETDIPGAFYDPSMYDDTWDLEDAALEKAEALEKGGQATL